MRFPTIAALLAALLVIAAPAQAATGHHRSFYVPRHGAKCRKGYVRRHREVRRQGKRRRVRVCAKRHRVPPAALPAASTPARATKLHAHLDPSYTRDPRDPFKVTYAYSASATQQVVGGAAGATLVEEPAPLPAGVLSLYSDGRLECAINVGSGVEGSECPVNYAELGEHHVTTIYASGEQSATETEVEQISPLATTTTLNVRYISLAEPVEVRPTSTEEAEGARAIMHIGDLFVEAAVSPATAPAPLLDCGENASSESITPAGCYQLSPGEPAHVYERNCGGGETVFITSQTQPAGIEQLHSTATNRFSPGSLEAGQYHLRAIREDRTETGSTGYARSEATAALRFAPQMAAIC